MGFNGGVYMMINSDTFNTAFRNYVFNARWWPWKGSYVNVEPYVIDTTGKLSIVLMKIGDALFHVPLMKTEKIPSELTDRGFCVDDECFLEAEYSPDYLNEFMKLRVSKYVELLSSIEDIKVYVARPLTLESTNSIAVYETNKGTLVLKSYRLLPDVNIETLILKHLARKKYKYIPKVHGLLFIDNLASGILMDYVKGLGDGGAPFYASLLDYLEGRKERYTIGLASKLGVIIGEMHIALNTDSEEDFFGVENVTDRDLTIWINRVEKMYSSGLKRIEKLSINLEKRDREEVEYWRKLAEEAESIIYEAVNYLEKYTRDLYKARTHQDLHLAQMIYVGDGEIDFVITDFEGEPGRNREERLMKEPLLRDIASMIRSYHYLSHAVLMNKFSASRHDASTMMVKNDPTFNWRIRHVIAMTFSYIARVHGVNILGYDENKIVRNIWIYLYPWVVERAVYEFFYESLYRPLWISIPVAGLLEARKYLVAPRI